MRPGALREDPISGAAAALTAPRSAAAAAPILSIEGLTVFYGRTRAVGPLSLTVKEGEFVSLLGPSGCGKTTTLRCVAGFVQPSRGDIRLRGRSIVKEPPHRRKVGLVFQNYALFPHLNVRDNIAFGPRRHHFPKDEIARRVEDIIARTGLTGLAERLPAQLSGGQQQRVALGRALALDPDVLLLDEPLSNLDRKLRQQLRGELRRIHREFRKTLIYVTHDQEEALSLSDRIVVMMGGDIIQIGTPREIYERPASALVSEFVGECLSYCGRVIDLVAGQDGAAVIECEDGTRWQVALDDDTLIPGDPVKLTIRAESVEPMPDDEGQAANVFQTTIRDKYFTGERTRLVCDAPGGVQIPVGVAPNSADAARDIGSELRCRVEPAAIRCFPETAR
jgi:spermidine/putrescine transport system ATP-binding protein